MSKRGFASDNNAGVHPDVWFALRRADDGHAPGYGHDAYTESVAQRLCAALGGASAYFVFNGTAGNVLCLSTVCRSYHAVICAETAHLNTDECGAPELHLGVKLLTAAAPLGKLTVEHIAARLGGRNDEHRNQPRAVSLTQSTELGATYTLNELRTLADYAHSEGLYVHLDGARMSNAAAFLGCELRDLAAHVDFVTVGGTKNGLMGAEAVVLMRPEFDDFFKYRQKQFLQLASKMRYLAAQFDAFLTDDYWRRHAQHANAMARRLADRLTETGFAPVYPVEANGVFVCFGASLTARLLEHYFFYVWDETTQVVRLMCSWDTTEADVDDFVRLVAQYCRK